MGASPNYKDGRGLTAVYLTVTKKTDPKICEVLLHDHASLGGQDSQGWQEVHQVRGYNCKYFNIDEYIFSRNSIILKQWNYPLDGKLNEFYHLWISVLFSCPLIYLFRR